MANKFLGVGGTDGTTARPLRTDSAGTLETKHLSRATQLIDGSATANGGTVESAITDVTNSPISLAYRCTSNTRDFEINVSYYNTQDEKLDEETIFTRVPARAGVVNFRPRHNRVTFEIINNSSSNRTFHLEYSANVATEISITKSKLRKTTYKREVGTLNQSEPIVLFDDHVFDEKTTAWGLYLFEYGRTLQNNLDHIKIRVEFANQLEGEDISRKYRDQSNGNLTFRQDFSLSVLDEYNTALIVDSTDTLAESPSVTHHSIILAGKYVNIPLGNLMRITLFSTKPDALMNFMFQSATIIEEGNY